MASKYFVQDPIQAIQAQNEAMARCAKTANPAFVQAFTVQCLTMLPKQEYITSCDVRDKVKMRRQRKGTEKSSGCIMRALAQLGFVEKTGRWEKSKRVRNNNRDICVWKSLLYVGPVGPPRGVVKGTGHLFADLSELLKTIVLDTKGFTTSLEEDSRKEFLEKIQKLMELVPVNG